MALTHLGSFTLGEINLGLFAALGFLNPLTAQLDLFLTGAFGLGPFLADLQAQFAAAIAAQANLGIQISNPFASIQALFAVVGQLQAALQAALAFGFPTVALQLNAQLAAAAALAATLQVKIGGIKALIAGAIALKIPVLQFIAGLDLSAGPVHLLVFDGQDLSPTGAAIASAFAAGLGPTNPIPPLGATVSGVLLVTQNPSAFAAMQAILKTS